MNYKLITSEFDGKNGKGDSLTFGVDASYPFIRSRTQNLYLGLNLDQKAFDNQLSAATTSKYDITSAGVALNGNLFDELLGGGVNSASVAIAQGNVALGALDQNESANVGGSFSKTRYSVSRQQFITDKITFYTAFMGQQSSDLLDSSEKFYLGGANGVRAFPSSEGGGASGNMINLELRGRLPKGFLLTGFYDYGDMRNNDSSKSYSLKGAGVSLAWQADSGLLLKATWAHRISENPNLTSAGNDQDGSYINDRFWLVASVPFSFSGGKSAAPAPSPNKEATVVEQDTERATPPQTVASETPTAALVKAEPLVVTELAQTPSASVASNNTSPESLVADSTPYTQSYRDTPLIVYGIQRKTDPLPSETKLMLDDVVKVASLNPNSRIEVSGHTDRTKVSKNGYNMKLSIERASVAQQYLVAKGVPVNRIKTVGYGFTKPMASNETQSGRDQNRRVEIKLID